MSTALFTARRWPWPEDTREDKAKRIALSYRELLNRIARGEHEYGLPLDPAGELHRLDQQWAQYDGTHWVAPMLDPFDDRDWVTAEVAGHWAGVEPTTIRKWAERKRKGGEGIDETLGPDGKPRYNISDLRLFDARRKQARAARTRRKWLEPDILRM